MKTGIQLIAIERDEQMNKHGRTINDDVAYNDSKQLVDAALMLLGADVPNLPPKDWDAKIWYKMTDKTYKQKLIIAGALVAAEIDRIDFPNSENEEQC